MLLVTSFNDYNRWNWYVRICLSFSMIQSLSKCDTRKGYFSGKQRKDYNQQNQQQPTPGHLCFVLKKKHKHTVEIEEKGEVKRKKDIWDRRQERGERGGEREIIGNILQRCLETLFNRQLQLSIVYLIFPLKNLNLVPLLCFKAKKVKLIEI